MYTVSVPTNQIGPHQGRLVPDITPPQVNLLLGDAVPHRFLGLFAAGVEAAVLPTDIELVCGDEAHEDDVCAEDCGKGVSTARGVFERLRASGGGM